MNFGSRQGDQTQNMYYKTRIKKTYGILKQNVIYKL